MKTFSVRDKMCRGVLVTAAIGAVSFLSGAAVAQSPDPVIFSFSTVGDSRTDPASPDQTTLLANPNPTTQGGVPSLTGTILPQDNMWVTNSEAFQAIISGVKSQNPNLLFFNGDMIYGYGRPTLPSAWANGLPNSWTTAETVSPDTIFEYIQYAYWRGMIANLFLNGTYVIPVPGNHETQCSTSGEPYSLQTPVQVNPNCFIKHSGTGYGNGTGKNAYADNENMFRFNMGDLTSDLVTNIRFSNITGYFATNVSGLGMNGEPAAPTASTNNGNITSSQTGLTFSFDIQVNSSILLHFVVINTDPAGADDTAPSDWIVSDFAAAKARGVTNIFVFGHKPAFTYNYAAITGGSVAQGATNPGPGGLDSGAYDVLGSAALASRNLFWSTIAQYNATYFSGHEHTVNVAQYADPLGVYSTTPYQVIVGSGGSPFDDKLVGTCSSVNPPGCVEPQLTNPYDRYYAWATIQVHQSGNVSLQVNGFSDQFAPTQDLTIYDVASLQSAGAAQSPAAKKTETVHHKAGT
jgi:hypothetical protein